MSTARLLAGWRSTVAQEAGIGVVLAACCLALFLVVDYGNSFGYDEWVHVYLVSHVRTISYLSRPIGLWSAYTLYPIFRTDHVAYSYVVLLARAASAFLLYRLVRLIAPARPMFAFTAGLFMAIYLIHDVYFVLTFLESDDNFTVQPVMLLALNLGVAYLLDNRPVRSWRVVSLVAGSALAAVAVLMREASAPVLLGIPALVVLLKRRWSRANLAGVAVWAAVAAACSAIYVLPLLGLAPSTYTSSSFHDLDLDRMLVASATQFRQAFRGLVFFNLADLYEYRLPALLTASVCLAAGWVARLRLERASAGCAEPGMPAPAELGIWLGAGLAATWLGFSAFLPTVLAASSIRTHFLAAPGEAVALAAGLWLVSCLAPGARSQRFIRLGGVALVAAAGAVTAGSVQHSQYRYGGNWENAAYFVRSLAHLVPQVEPPTLFVYIENPALEETPFIDGFAFQYGIRYFYDDRATGLIPTDTIFDRWSAGDAGITMEERWLPEERVFGWNEMIFVTRDDDARLRILDTLPDGFYTEARQASYRPRARIQMAFVAERVRETFPVVAGPDWSGRQQFLSNEP